MATGDRDWDPGAYGRFRGLRLRPALDLLAGIRDLPEGAVADLGCGAGAVGPVLKRRWPGRALEGVDTSPAMLAEAAATGVYDRLSCEDAAAWSPSGPVALIFSNAALHWVSDHDRVLPRLVRLLVAGGTIAVQMPRQFGAPSHRFLRDIAADTFPDRFDLSGWVPPVAAPVDYARMLAPFGEVTVWETEYVQRLDPVGNGHPVRAFTGPTAMRPYLDPMTEEEAGAFTRRYDAALAAAYPAEADGSVLFPFRRLFFTVVAPGRPPAA